MKWIQIIISIAEIVLPYLAKAKKDRVEKELEIVTTGIEKFSKTKDAEEKGKAVKGIICDLAMESGITKRFHKRIKKYEDRLWKKLF